MKHIVLFIYHYSNKLSTWSWQKLYSREGMKHIVLFIYHYSNKLSTWSWQKLYSNRKTGLGYKR